MSPTVQQSVHLTFTSEEFVRLLGYDPAHWTVAWIQLHNLVASVSTRAEIKILLDEIIS